MSLTPAPTTGGRFQKASAKRVLVLLDEEEPAAVKLLVAYCGGVRVRPRGAQGSTGGGGEGGGQHHVTMPRDPCLRPACARQARGAARPHATRREHERTRGRGVPPVRHGEFISSLMLDATTSPSSQ